MNFLEETLRGKIKWFDISKGYGFIINPDISKDIYFHSTQCMMEGIINPTMGQQVEFQLFEDKNGLKAMNIYLI